MAEQYHIQTVARIPMQPEMAAPCDRGNVEFIDVDWLDNIMMAIEN